MRKYLIENLLDMVKTLDDLNDELLRLIIKEDKKSCKQLLADGQECAIAVGNAIEQELGEQNGTISILEEYCELAWLCSEEMISSRQKKILIKMRKKINEIRQGIKTINIQYDVVFLPYKASMWDSMESIWKAAKDDKRCRCFVIPIPYYDKNPDGSLGQRHYEVNLFPEYVPVISYEEYNLNTRQPEVIYFHNPYDQFNFVTSVHPAYYSEALKKCTMMLVYVPYFCSGGILPKSFYHWPSYNYADKIIIQSEGMIEDIDLNVRDKYVALGSPKFDAVLADRMMNISEEWLSKAEGRKKVLYNTSISSLLSYGDAALDKMRRIFLCVQEKSKILLIWRPHPLTKSTLKSMRPQLLERYETLEKYYLDCNIGIMDTTEDVTNVTRWADAYLGEKTSSIVHLFGVQGKPIFLTNEMIIDVPSKEDLKILDIIKIKQSLNKDFLWVITRDNLLCQVSKDGESNITNLLSAPNNQVGYCDILETCEKVYVVPNMAKNIYVYNKINGEKKYIILKESVNIFYKKFLGLSRYKEYIYLWPYSYQSIIKISIITDEIVYIGNFYQILGAGKDKTNPLFAAYTDECNNNKVILSSAIDNRIFVYNMENDTYEVKNIGGKENVYLEICCDAGHCWLQPDSQKGLISWNVETDEVKETLNLPLDYGMGINNYPMGYQGRLRTMGKMCYCGGYVVVLPYGGNGILKYDIQNDTFCKMIMNVGYLEGERKNSYYQEFMNYTDIIRITDTKVAFISSYDYRIIVLDVITDITVIIKSQITISKRKEHISSRAVWSETVLAPYASFEEKNWTIEEYFDYLYINDELRKSDQLEAYKKVACNMDGTCGEKIHLNVINGLEG